MYIYSFGCLVWIYGEVMLYTVVWGMDTDTYFLAERCCLYMCDRNSIILAGWMDRMEYIVPT
jgi:hypothetical protein